MVEFFPLNIKNLFDFSLIGATLLPVSLLKSKAKFLEEAEKKEKLTENKKIKIKTADYLEKQNTQQHSSSSFLNSSKLRENLNPTKNTTKSNEYFECSVKTDLRINWMKPL